MDHHTAAESQSVERYLLGQMSAEERDAFEEHYFTCAECAEDVRAAAQFRANARTVLRNPNQPAAAERRGLSWWRWAAMVPVAASFFLLGTSYQTGREPLISSPDQYALRESERGPNVPRIPKAKSLVEVNFVVPPEAVDPPYECILADSAGKPLQSTVVKSIPGATARIFVRGNRLAPGMYALTLRHEGQIVANYSFQVE